MPQLNDSDSCPQTHPDQTTVNLKYGSNMSFCSNTSLIFCDIQCSPYYDPCSLDCV